MMTVTCPNCAESVQEDELLSVVGASGSDTDWYECPYCETTDSGANWGL